MERLQPILKQKFWILLGIGLVMTFVGWWMATGTMAATITTRQSEIKAAEGKVPSGEIPNNEWSAGLAAVNVQQDLAVKNASRILWERQRAKMTWPETVAEFAWKNGYRGAIDIAGRENYRQDYENDWRRVWETVRPFSRIDGSGIVDFSMAKLPRSQWGNLAPSADEMWDAQEDLWLLESLLQSITEVNGGPNGTRLDAIIHQIERLTLHGGQPAGQRTLPSAGGGSSTSTTAMPEMPGGFGSGGSSGGSSQNVSADFDVKEEFGDDALAGGGGQASGSTAMATIPGGMGGPSVKTKRYIDDDQNMPFKTRGFYMTVVMDHRKIPNLISELTASEKSAWPIEILRVQYMRLHEDDIDGRGMPGGGGFNSPVAGGTESFGNTGFPSTSSDAGFGQSTTSNFTLDTEGSGGTVTPQGQAALAALNNAVQDPNMARVSLCGIITLYREVKPEAVAPSPPPTGTPNSPVAPATQAVQTPANAQGTAETEVPKNADEGAKPTEEPAKPETDAKSDESSAKSDTADPSKPDEKKSDSKTDDATSSSPESGAKIEKAP